MHHMMYNLYHDQHISAALYTIETLGVKELLAYFKIICATMTLPTAIPKMVSHRTNPWCKLIIAFFLAGLHVKNIKLNTYYTHAMVLLLCSNSIGYFHL